MASWIYIALFAAVLCDSTFGYIARSNEFDDNELDVDGNGLDGPYKETALPDDLAIEDLYWKPYSGPPVPEDAILAGTTHRGGKNVGMYIGQVLVSEIPGALAQAVAIYNDTEYVTNTYTNTIHTNKNIKILCAKKDYVDRELKWVSSSMQQEYTPDLDFVIVGHEVSKVTGDYANLFIGRGTYSDTLLVGKVIMGRDTLRFYPYYGRRELLLKANFEILAYANTTPKSRK